MCDLCKIARKCLQKVLKICQIIEIPLQSVCIMYRTCTNVLKLACCILSFQSSTHRQISKKIKVCQFTITWVSLVYIVPRKCVKALKNVWFMQNCSKISAKSAQNLSDYRNFSAVSMHYVPHMHKCSQIGMLYFVISVEHPLTKIQKRLKVCQFTITWVCKIMEWRISMDLSYWFRLMTIWSCGTMMALHRSFSVHSINKHRWFSRESLFCD